MKRLSQWAELAAPALKETLERQPSLETRRRIEKLLAEPPLRVRDPEALRCLRSIRILEHIATPEAQQLLQSLATGAPEARLTQEAKASLERLTRLTNLKSRRKGGL